MPVVAAGAELEGPAAAVAGLLAAYLIAGQPLVGAWSQRRFRRALRTDPRARLRRYQRTALLEWSLLAAGLALVAAAPGLDLAHIGVALPRLSGGSAPYTIVGIAGLAVSVALLVALRRRVEAGAEALAPAEVAALLPRTAAERRAFAAVAVTAGVCEETLYRGLLLAIVVALFGVSSPGWLVLASAVAFGLAHAYQGLVGALSTAVLGGCLAVLYLGSASLLLPVLYHVLVDLRMLVLAVGRPHARHRASRDTPVAL